MMSNIRLINVEKAYSGAGPKAVEDLSLTIDSGEFLCLLGPSGCGKTTTLRMLAGLEHPTGGEIRIGERTIVSVPAGIYVPPEKRGLGLVFQSYALWPHMSVRDNVEFGLRLRNTPKEQRRRTADEVMEKLAIDRYAERYPNQLSGGQQQRVALARMLALQPEIILLDEPLSNLDAKLRLEMRAELKRIHREIGATIIFVTHDQWEAMTLASRIAVMSDGELQQLGSPDDIYERPANRFVAEFVGSLPINIVTFSGGAPAGPLEHWLAEVLAAVQAPAGVASIGIRPEALLIERGPAVAGALPRRAAEVVDVLPTGGSWIVELAVEGERIFAIAGTAPGLEPGDPVHLALNPEDIHMFDEMGQRIVAAPAGASAPRVAAAPA
jgi:iron(III) transport system ATP-binding protein